MAAIPRHLRKPEPRSNRTTDPQSLYLKKKGDYSTVLFYAFVQPTTAAIQAQSAYFNMQPFEPMYFKLMRATVASSLSIDRRTGDLKLTAPRLSLKGLVTQAVISQLVDQAKGQALTLVLGAKWAGVFGLLTQLNDLKKRLNNQRLLTKNDAVSKKKRFRERLKLIALLVGRSKGGNPISWQITAVNNYDKYESARAKYLKVIHEDLKNRGIKIDNRAKIGPRR